MVYISRSCFCSDRHNNGRTDDTLWSQRPRYAQRRAGRNRSCAAAIGYPTSNETFVVVSWITELFCTRMASDDSDDNYAASPGAVITLSMTKENRIMHNPPHPSEAVCLTLLW